MPRLDGIAATRVLLERHASPARVLMLTTFNQEAYVYDALRAGASGFLLKSAPPRELAGAIRTVAGGRRAARPGDHPGDDRGLRPAAASRRGDARDPRRR